ncbi:FecR domain-containing protein [Thauera humireducens]|uniref:FecR family protein n=1 Tax=Thauera humireducens TaxID=1134435 RepID=UPI002467AADC|nr:FecR family protein [Thauera humireducens]CAH1746781.1 FecR domain-containing protein [Thauera humireducens]
MPIAAKTSRVFAGLCRGLVAIGAFIVVLPAFAQDAGQVVLAVGDVRMAGQVLRVGDAVRVGAPLHTGHDGYLYIKTIDNGFLILRPDTAAAVAEYTVDAGQPGKSRFRIELNQGIARHITGEAVKSARQHFRFNTPVAAIGVRGTDFTAYADDRLTRVAVLSGGVVVSGFDEQCSPGGIGPCEGPQARELFAGQPGHLLQVEKDKALPELLQNVDLAPAGSPPPRGDEPHASQSASQAGTLEANLDPVKADRLEAIDTVLARPPIQWGRWRDLAGEVPTLPLLALLANHKLLAFNPYFALLRPNDAPWDNRVSGAVDFRMQGGEAVIERDNGSAYAAAVENGRLHVDFAQRRFSTGFDLVADGERIARRADGQVFADGGFENVSQFLGGNNMLVKGALGQDAKLRAAYLFQTRLDDRRVAYGSTAWVK